MKINGAQLFVSIDFLHNFYDEKVPYSKYVYIHLSEGTVTLRACSDIIIGSEVHYQEAFEGSFPPFVVELTRLRNFLRNNKKILDIEYQEGSVILKGKGTLKIHTIGESDYMICGFDDDENNYSVGSSTISITGEAEIDKFLSNIDSNIKWVDDTTISQQYRDFSWKKYLSTRKYKYNVSCLNLGINECVPNIEYENIIYSNFLNMLTNINGIKDLTISLEKNSTTFKAIATDLNINFFVKSRVLDGVHPIDDIYSISQRIIELNTGFVTNKAKFKDVLDSCMGYSEKDEVALFTLTGGVLNIRSQNENYDYSINENVGVTQKFNDCSFSVNLSSLKDIVNSVSCDEVEFFIDTSMTEVPKLVIYDKAMKIIYLFPTWNLY